MSNEMTRFSRTKPRISMRGYGALMLIGIVFASGG